MIKMIINIPSWIFLIFIFIFSVQITLEIIKHVYKIKLDKKKNTEDDKCPKCGGELIEMSTGLKTWDICTKCVWGKEK